MSEEVDEIESIKEFYKSGLPDELQPVFESIDDLLTVRLAIVETQTMERDLYLNKKIEDIKYGFECDIVIKNGEKSISFKGYLPDEKQQQIMAWVTGNDSKVGF